MNNGQNAVSYEDALKRESSHPLIQESQDQYIFLIRKKNIHVCVQYKAILVAPSP